jgi:hypothetical protein
VRVPSLLKTGVAGEAGQHPTGSLPPLDKDLPVAAEASRR